MFLGEPREIRSHCGSHASLLETSQDSELIEDTPENRVRKEFRRCEDVRARFAAVAANLRARTHRGLPTIYSRSINHHSKKRQIRALDCSVGA